MAEKKKKLKPFKTATGAVQFMRNFDPDNMVESSRKEIDKMISIFEKENEKLGPKKIQRKICRSKFIPSKANVRSHESSTNVREVFDKSLVIPNQQKRLMRLKKVN